MPANQGPPYRAPERTDWGPPVFRYGDDAHIVPLDFRDKTARTATANPFRQAAPVPQTNPFRVAAKDTPSANYVTREMAARGLGNAALAIPSAGGSLVADALRAGEAGVKTAAGYGLDNLRSVFGMERVQRPGFSERYADESNAFDSALRSIPRPTTRGIEATLASVPALMPGGETPGQAYDRAEFADAEQEAEMRRAHPVAATAGDIGGDIAAIALARRGSGAGNLIRRAETRLVGKAATEAAQTLADDVTKTLTPMSRRLARGGLRGLEAGVEAAVLDVIKDPNADPLDTAAIAAGGQLVGSGILTGAKPLVTGGPGMIGLKITAAAMTTWGFLQVMKSATPGGEDRILESMESGYDKVALLLGAGAGAAAIGATRYGRGNAALTDQSRRFLDGMSTVNRGTTLSLLTDWTEGDAEDRAAIERVLTEVSKDPTYQGKTEAERSIVRQIRRGSGSERYTTGGGF